MPNNKDSRQARKDYRPRVLFEVDEQTRARMTRQIPTGYIRPLYTAFTLKLLEELESDRREAFLICILRGDLGLTEIIVDHVQWLDALVEQYLKDSDVASIEVTLSAFLSWIRKTKGWNIDR